MKRLDSLTINDYLAIFRRRIWYILIIPPLVGIATVAVVWQLPHVYQSETTIAMSGRFVPEDYIRSIDHETNIDRLDFVKQQLQRRTFLEGIIQEFHLGNDTRPGGMDRMMDTLKAKIEFTTLGPNAFKLGYTSTDPMQAQAVTRRLAELVIQLNDSFRKEKVQTADRFLEDQFAEAQAELSKAEQRLLAFRNETNGGVSDAVTADGLRTLQLQLATVDSQLDAANDRRRTLERRLAENQQLKKVLKAAAPSTATVKGPESPPSSPPTPQEIQLANKRAELAAASLKYTRLHPEVIRLTKEVQDLELLVERTRPEQAPAVAAKPELAPEPVLPALDSVDLLPVEIQEELQQAQRDIAKIEHAKNTLSTRISVYQMRLNPPAEVAKRLAELTRDYDGAKQRYTLLADKRLSSEMAARVDSNESNELFKVVEPAFLPERPSGPNRTRLAAIGGFAGILLGFGIAFLRDILDPRFYSEEDILKELQFPTLTSIPTVVNTKQPKKQLDLTVVRMKNKRDDGATFSLQRADEKLRNVVFNPTSVAGENYRLLCRLLSETRKDNATTSLVISSTVPGEGKTFSACCIAAILAQESGERVLLVDGDLRRPSTAEVLGLSHIKPSARNFSMVLRGKAGLEESVIGCDGLNLFWLQAGTFPSSTVELLNSPQLELFMRKARAAFDWVIVDSSPLLGIPDAHLLADACDGMLLVVRAATASVKLAQAALKKTDRDRVIGVLLNCAEEAHSRYYGGYGYYGTRRKSSNTSMLKLHDAD
jgi:polysaccharide chain length determinant protein (PEP-CTERM system associated)